MVSQKLVNEICPTTTQRWVQQGALLVDVRENVEVIQLAFDVPHIINIPLSEFEDRYTEIPHDRNVVVVCNNGSKSLRAAGFLINLGYTKVVNMKLGLQRWVEKGFPTKGDTSFVKDQNSCCSTSGCC
ncbi:MAG TPA: rhodanese-like domain-containing protein [Saprospiraceae bacterium]|nr:rhodanese-like domain-containing protein [Saprospiraceae bacterium]